ncbi:hypothetical protein [Alloprevotella tannerae]|uniref:hypothetical protein n=1 Tax=Alloprevotella tannerae TaxID=76122 RepID=UPI00288BD47E|nr:hypothetical protein [Alloprevotella tannerae]
MGSKNLKKSSSLDIFLRFYHKKIQAKNEKSAKNRDFIADLAIKDLLQHSYFKAAPFHLNKVQLRHYYAYKSDNSQLKNPRLQAQSIPEQPQSFCSAPNQMA